MAESNGLFRSRADVRRFSHKLGTAWVGRDVEYLRETGSTNSVVKELARCGASPGLVCVADYQSTGRGRMGRAWSCPRSKGLLFSLTCRTDIPVDLVALVGFAGALGVSEAVSTCTGLAPSLKWPNDLLLHGKKFCGVLTESELQRGRLLSVTLGIGINVNLGEDELPDSASTSLMLELGAYVSRRNLLARCLTELEHRLDSLSHAPETICAEYRARCETQGQPVTIVSADGTVSEGTAVGVDGKMRLVVRDSEGTEKAFCPSEVSVRSREAPDWHARAQVLG